MVAVRRKSRPFFHGAVGPLYAKERYFGGVAQPEEHARIAGGTVAAVRGAAPPQRRLSGPLQSSDGAQDIVAPAGRTSHQAQAQPMFILTDLVQQQPYRPVVIGDHNVDVAVVVQVAEGGAAANVLDGQRLALANFTKTERTAAQVMEKLAALAQGQGHACLRLLFDEADFAIGAKNVEKAVVVIIQGAGAEACKG